MDLYLRGRRVPIDAVLFDLDGTLVHSLGDFVVAPGALLDELGLPPMDARRGAPLPGQGVDHLVHTVLAGLVGEQRATELFPGAKPFYWRHDVATNGRHSHVYEGIHEGLDRLRAGGVRLACSDAAARGARARAAQRPRAGHAPHRGGGNRQVGRGHARRRHQAGAGVSRWPSGRGPRRLRYAAAP